MVWIPLENSAASDDLLNFPELHFSQMRNKKEIARMMLRR